MKALAIAFGRDYRHPRLPLEHSSAFYGMPVGEVVPASGKLRPDIAPFVLNNSVVMDGGFFERLTQSPSPAYTDIANFYKRANQAGKLLLVDFDSDLDSERRRLDEMLTIDVEDLESWIPRIIESMEIWDNLVSRSDRLKSQLATYQAERNPHWTVERFDVSPGHEFHAFQGHGSQPLCMFLDEIHSEDVASRSSANWNSPGVNLYKALLFKSHRKTKTQQEVLRAYIESRLAYVNANIVLSQKYGAAIYDWNDLSPFYRRKFAQVGLSPPADESQVELRKLFSLLFPSLEISDYGSFFRALESGGVASLRSLCLEAASGRVEFDPTFAASVWREQLKWSEDQREFSRRMSWWSLPANAIPYVGTAVSFAAQKISEGVYEHQNPEPHPWLFVFSDLFKPGEVES